MLWNNPSNIAVPEYINEEFVRTALEKEWRGDKIEIEEITLSWGCKPGENYCSRIYRLQIKFKSLLKAKDEGVQTISLIVKTILITKDTQFLEDVGVYIKEKVMYSDVLPRLEVLMDDLKFGTKCFYASKSPVQTVVLKDLAAEGFINASRQNGLDWQHCSLILQQLAKFHATSMILAQRDLNIMKKFQKGSLCEETLLQTDTFFQMFEGDLRQLIKISKHWTGYQEITEKLQRYYDNFRNISCQLAKRKEGDRIFVLNHGDMWINNFMFAYENDKHTHLPTKAVFLDFQYSFYGSPGCDLNFFLNTSVPLDLLKNRRDDLIACYYHTFAQSLEYLRYGAVPSLDDLKYELRSRELFGFFALFGFLSMVTMPEDLVADTSIESFANDEYKQKMLDAVYGRDSLQQHFRYSLERLNDLGVLDEF